MKVRAYAKVNLALDVVRKREDGYHDLEMIMAPITLHDLIYINVIPEGIEIESNSKIVPTDQRNIMYKVAKLMQERYGLKKGVKIFVYKHIPTQAGLAGGSADGAAVIKAMNKLFHLNLSYEEMAALGKEVGADIPFCIYEKTAFVEGVGEKLQFIDEPFEKMSDHNIKLMLDFFKNQNFQVIFCAPPNKLESIGSECGVIIPVLKITNDNMQIGKVKFHEQ